MYISFRWWIPYFSTPKSYQQLQRMHLATLLCSAEEKPSLVKGSPFHQASLTQASAGDHRLKSCQQPERPQNTVISLKASPSTTVHNGAAKTYRTYKATAGNDQPTGNDHYWASSCLQVLEQKMVIFSLFYLPRGFLPLEYSAALSSQRLAAA